MGVGIPAEIAELWRQYDEESYEAFLLEFDGEGYWFTELPPWAHQTNVGPFFVDDDGVIYGISMRASQKGEWIGNLL